MCGIAGFLEGGSRSGVLAEIAGAMADPLTHRGPDDHGVWVDVDAGIGFGHRRLSILDLSVQGHQPMWSHDGRHVLVYNGEVYNHRELRQQLGGESREWRGHSDTEVLLTAIQEWGLERTLPRLNGMFAFAVWDRAERTLHLARDPLGEKPLYYGWQGSSFLFGSELKSVRAHPAFRGELDPDAVAAYMRFGYVPAPRSIFRGIRKLRPGCWLSIGPGEVGREPAERAYWDPATMAATGAATPLQASEAELADRLDALLRNSVLLRMEADVPLGAFLSGGVDSSTVVAMMQAQSPRPVRTFSIGFAEAAYDEARHARAVAEHLGTDHTELYVTPQEALDVVPDLPRMYDEPFADSSQIPTHLVARLARRSVTVSLSGDGGDELFGGYNRHQWGGALWRSARAMPRPVRRAVAGVAAGLRPEVVDRAHEALQPILPRFLNHRNPSEKLRKLAELLGASNEAEVYTRLVSHWDPETVVRGASAGAPSNGFGRNARLTGLSEQMMYADLVTYLPDDILVKVDRATMAVSLESRIPLLDTRVVELAWRLPHRMKIRDGRGKYLLRQVLYRYVPASLIERPKTGFAMPVDRWLRGPLRDWAESLLSESALRDHGLLEVEPIRRRWEEHLSGRRNWQQHLWDVLMLQDWVNGSSEFRVQSSEFRVQSSEL